MTATPPPSSDPAERRSPDDRVVSQAIDILDRHRTMAISTIRPDGWPQTTIVGFVNEGLSVYFMIARSSQKYSNIQNDDRVSIAVGQEPREISDAKAVYAGAHAAEITDTAERAHAWRLLEERHPNLHGFEMPAGTDAAVMQAVCKHVSVVDYAKGLVDAFTA